MKFLQKVMCLRMNRERIKVHPHLDFEAIDKRYQTAKRPREQTYWLVIRMMSVRTRPGRGPSSQEMSPQHVAHLLGLSVQHVRRIIHAYNEKGPAGFLPKPRKPPASGRPRRLNSAQEEHLHVVLAPGITSDGRRWTAERVQQWLYSEYKIKVNCSTAWRYMNRRKAGGQGSLF